MRTVLARSLELYQAFLVPDNPATGWDFAAATIETATARAVARALEAQTGGIEAVAMHAIAAAVEGLPDQALSQEELMSATISAVDTAAIAIALYGPAELSGAAATSLVPMALGIAGCNRPPPVRKRKGTFARIGQLNLGSGGA